MDFDKFSISYHCHQIIGDTLNHESQKHLLAIHGGSRDRSAFYEFRKNVYENGFGSTAFDCLGHGESSTTLSESSLYHRTEQALSVLQSLAIPTKACIGVSMGAYNAIQLSKIIALDALILIVPGTYTPEAYQVNFGEQFSQIIRTAYSWKDSDSWEILSNFSGKLLIVSAENDQVVPHEIPQKMFESARIATWKQHLIIPKLGHKGFMQKVLQDKISATAFKQAVVSCLE